MSDVQEAARFILEARSGIRRNGALGVSGFYWRPAAVLAMLRSRWPEVTAVEAYRECSRMKRDADAARARVGAA